MIFPFEGNLPPATELSGGLETGMQIFEKLEALIEAPDTAAAAMEARTLLRQLNARSEVLSELVDDFLIDVMTMSFVAEAYGGKGLQAARTLAQKRLAKIKLLAGILA
jgi:hypothetical protein